MLIRPVFVADKNISLHVKLFVAGFVYMYDVKFWPTGHVMSSAVLANFLPRMRRNMVTIVLQV